ncbi:MAG: hypothetical protein JSU01_22955 [Bacteroidetes bacterium]|nr:hypothetical protein [Bacteroidota bacterium]
MKIQILAALLFLAFAGCKKNYFKPHALYDGVITGYDLRKCMSPACGGLFITIKNDTSQYRTSQTLSQLGIDESSKFPIAVELNYKRDTGIYHNFNYIVVTHIEVVH